MGCAPGRRQSFPPVSVDTALHRKVCNKNYAEIYDIIHPREPISEPRDVRLGPMHQRHRQLGAVFTTFAGLELPNWFESIGGWPTSTAIRSRSGPDGAVHWSPIQGAEHLATRERAGLFDLTGLSIIEVAGPDALALVESLCSNKMDVALGRLVYTTWLTDRGGVRRDLTVARLGPDRFWMFVGREPALAISIGFGVLPPGTASPSSISPARGCRDRSVGSRGPRHLSR